MTQLPGGFETILIVDDEDLVRNVGRRALTRAGYTVLEAENGVAALEVVRAHGREIGLILLDIIMPEMNGEEFYYALREGGFSMPVVLNSAFSGDDEVTRLMDAGAAGFLRKPYELADLMAAVRDGLSGNGARSVS